MARLFGTKFIEQAVSAVIVGGAYKATKYVSDKYVVKATRRHKVDRRDSHREVVVTVGAPNYLEREFIKVAKRAGEKFPIKGIQVRFK